MALEGTIIKVPQYHSAQCDFLIQVPENAEVNAGADPGETENGQREVGQNLGQLDGENGPDIPLYVVHRGENDVEDGIRDVGQDPGQHGGDGLLWYNNVKCDR